MTLESIHRPTNDSSILLRVGVSEIGLKSSWIDLGGRNFGIGTTFALFQRLDTMPSLIDELNMWQIGSERANAKSRRNQFGMPSGPGDLRTLMRDSLWNTSNGCITNSQAASLVSTEYTAGNGVRSFDTCCSELFIRSASSCASPPATLFIRGSSSGFAD